MAAGEYPVSVALMGLVVGPVALREAQGLLPSTGNT